VGITTEATEITEKNSLSGSVYSVCSVVDFKLTRVPDLGFANKQDALKAVLGRR